MTNQAKGARPLPATGFLKLPEGGAPYLEGSKCTKCGAVYLGTRDHCSKCCGQDCVKPIKLANKGKLYSYCIVHRSFPGIDVPYISAIVDLEGGGTVKGNLVDMDPDPKKIKFDMPVDVVYRDALGRKDAQGNSYMSYFFKPAA